MDGRGEFIGEHVEITHHSDPSLCGMSGIVVNETRETLVIKANGSEKIVSKRPGKFSFSGGDILGGKIAYRPQDRIKKVKP
mgnify:FL=1|tara:strand:- start:91 stop:333 length:243 start_codon:yes stop_codon:yes gene_type:complete